MKLKMTLAVAALLTIGLSSAAAYADTVTFTLNNPNGVVLQTTGGSVTYSATVSALSSNLAPVFLNGDSITLTGPALIDDSDFLANFPVSLAPGTSFTGNMFVVTVPAGLAFGTYLGSVVLQGGPNSLSEDPLGNSKGVPFDVVVAPEPGSIVLSLTGAAGLAWAGFKRKLSGLAR